MKYSISALLALLATLATPLRIPSTNVEAWPTHVTKRQSPVSIDQLFKDRGKLYIGVSSDNGIIQQDKTMAIIQQNFGQVTPEYSMKWDTLQPSPGNFTWGNSDFIVNWAQENDKSIRGHTLLWHQTLPSWVSQIGDRRRLTVAIETHIKTVVGRYKGKIRSWDVVNEAFNDDGTLRNSTFLNVLGESYIGIAFRAARAADASAKLYVNDYNLDNKDWAKAPAVVRKVNQWISQGIPIDGIGTQTHLVPNMSSNIQESLQLLASSRVSEIAITELDITTAPPGDYATVVGACLNVPKCRGITVWGVSDKQSWNSAKTPLLFDNEFNPKPAYNAIVKRLS